MRSTETIVQKDSNEAELDRMAAQIPSRCRSARIANA
jgi:hypothetical protein